MTRTRVNESQRQQDHRREKEKKGRGGICQISKLTKSTLSFKMNITTDQSIRGIYTVATERSDRNASIG